MTKNTYLMLQAVVVVLVVPAAYVLWLDRYGGNVRLAALVVALPVVSHYLLAFSGINVLKLWAFRAGPRLGRMPVHIGLSVGGLEAFLAYACVGPQLPASFSVVGTGLTALAVGSVVAFWNWMFDALAIRVGLMEVYFPRRVPHARPTAASAEYAPAHFGAVGATYGVAIAAIDHLLFVQGRFDLYGAVAAASVLALVLVPSLVYTGANLVRFGRPGLRPTPPGDAA